MSQNARDRTTLSGDVYLYCPGIRTQTEILRRNLRTGKGTCGGARGRRNYVRTRPGIRPRWESGSGPKTREGLEAIVEAKHVAAQRGGLLTVAAGSKRRGSFDCADSLRKPQCFGRRNKDGPTFRWITRRRAGCENPPGYWTGSVMLPHEISSAKSKTAKVN